jgi:hypothetical protein
MCPKEEGDRDDPSGSKRRREEGVGWAGIEEGILELREGEGGGAENTLNFSLEFEISKDFKFDKGFKNNQQNPNTLKLNNTSNFYSKN